MTVCKCVIFGYYVALQVQFLNRCFSTGSLVQWSTPDLSCSRPVVGSNQKSEIINVTSGVPQGSILGPVLFNLYVNNLAGKLPEIVKSHQYADDTTMYAHCKPKELQLCESDMQRALNDLHLWSTETNITLNASKTKTILFSTTFFLETVGREHERTFLLDGSRKKHDRVVLLYSCHLAETQTFCVFFIEEATS